MSRSRSPALPRNVSLERDIATPEAVISFRDHSGAVGIPIQTRAGKMCFYMWQRLVAEPDGGSFRLSTKEYVYRIQEGPSRTEDRALIRFEYNVDPHKDGYARHHVQMSGSVESDVMGTLDLDHLHVPTGWVTIEEVLRFLIADLKFKPHCGKEWGSVLDEGYRRFFEDFTSKRYRTQAVET